MIWVALDDKLVALDGKLVALDDKLVSPRECKMLVLGGCIVAAVLLVLCLGSRLVPLELVVRAASLVGFSGQVKSRQAAG